MEEGKLKEVFNLMYKKLTELAVDDRFKLWIERLRNNDFEKNKVKDDNFFFEKLVSTYLSVDLKAKYLIKSGQPSKKHSTTLTSPKYQTTMKKK